MRNGCDRCLILLFLLALATAGCAPEKAEEIRTGNVIFIHPDGTAYNTWAAFRIMSEGPDGMTNWDRMDEMGLYRAHQLDAIGTSSNAGATAHAFGVKAEMNDYGVDPDRPFKSLSRKDFSIMIEAKQAGYSVGVINSGHICEPGTGVFLASAKSRSMNDEISDRIIHSGADLIFSGGEQLLLPKGVTGHFGRPGMRRDDRNLIEEAEGLGYTVVYTREELLNLPADAERVLGIFAPRHTFNAYPEEDLKARGMPLYDPDAPTLAEMTRAALAFLERKGRPFLLVVEEEGTDNFGNANNATGVLTALGRTDEAIGVVMDFIGREPETLLVMAADSDAGGMQVHLVRDTDMEKPLRDRQANRAPVDGRDGTASLPFLAGADRTGRRMGFAISWATSGDVYGGVVARAHGLNAELLPNNVDNTDIYRLMYATLFGRWLE
ncbi:MAG: alkaline phosphatase [Candidatus Latescibacteria bacterium]|jgi:alkaline phosphatase|nr:alkaline phosphatase [Candidatus Latescibacterota bacterium]